jgi:hypothetical protein
MTRDPYKSPLPVCHCPSCGHTHILGGLDCFGQPVGYIEHPDGPVYRDRTERDAITVGKAWANAFKAWNQTGGMLGHRPDLDALIREYDALPESREAIEAEIGGYLWVAEMLSTVRPYLMLGGNPEQN